MMMMMNPPIVDVANNNNEAIEVQDDDDGDDDDDVTTVDVSSHTKTTVLSLLICHAMISLLIRKSVLVFFLDPGE
jgi:hypothetical protein